MTRFRRRGMIMKKSKKPVQYTAFSNVFFVFGYLFKINKKLYLYRIPLTLLNVFSPLINAYLFSALINELTIGTKVKNVIGFIIIISSVNLIVSLIQKMLACFDSCEKEKTLLYIKSDLGRTVSKMQLSEIESPRIKDFISLAGDTTIFSRTMDAAMALVGSLIATLTYSSVLISIQPWLILAIAINLLVQLLFGRLKLKDNDKWRTVQEPIFRKLWYFEGLLCDPRYGKELRVNRLQPWIFQKANFVYEGECAPIVKTNFRNITIFDLITQFFKFAELMFIYSFLSIKVIFDGMLIGNFTFYLSNATNFSNALNAITSNVLELKECGTFIREFRFFDSFRQKLLPKSCSEKFNSNNDYSIEFKNVSFKYPNTDCYVLKDISFKIQEGEKLSLVGVNGSGKTTLIKLLCRFYEPTEGSISIGGVDIRKYNLNDYNKLLGVVFQDFKLFSFSIKENVSMGEQEDSDNIVSCLEKSGLLDKIKGLMLGVDTSVYKDFDENGIEFSGGEGQKLAIARALYKDSPIMILDEPTASLDPIAEYEILKKILSVSQGKTSIIISHRLSATRHTDKIAVIDKGVLVEFGTHNDLMNIENGVYKEMFLIQKSNYS